MDFKDLASNLGLDEKDFNELIEIFTATSYSDIIKITFGIEENNAKTVALAAHSIKGASGNLGFKEISSIAQNLEMDAKEGDITKAKEKTDKISEMLKAIENSIKTN